METKRCPFCGEEILAAAKKCKHCGEWLEKHEHMKEKKTCPICGEEIDADLEICPLCNEPTSFMENKDTDVAHHHVMETNDGLYLYCKTCKEKISTHANSCPKCGDEDPFFFHDIIKTRKNSNFGCGMAFAIIIICSVVFQCMGSEDGISKQTKGFIFILIMILVFCSAKYSSYLNTKKHKEEMFKIFNAKNDSRAQSIWERKLEDLSNDG